jgi:hypothetical protein
MSILKDGIVKVKTMSSGSEFEVCHYSNSSDCYDKVKIFCEEIWQSRKKTDAYINYNFEYPEAHSIGPLMKDDKFQLGFSLLYKNGKLICCAGLRNYDDETTISLARFLSSPSVYPYGNAFILPLHVELSKNSGFKSTIITFNKYNSHLVNYYQNILPFKRDVISKQAWNVLKNFEYKNEKKINEIEQVYFENKFAESL